jgi:hypothetical protein
MDAAVALIAIHSASGWQSVVRISFSGILNNRHVLSHLSVGVLPSYARMSSPAVGSGRVFLYAARMINAKMFVPRIANSERSAKR